MEEILLRGIWKNRLSFHSIACPAYQIAKFLHLHGDVKIITTISAIFSSSGSMVCLTDSSRM